MFEVKQTAIGSYWTTKMELNVRKEHGNMTVCQFTKQMRSWWFTSRLFCTWMLNGIVLWHKLKHIHCSCVNICVSVMSRSVTTCYFTCKRVLWLVSPQRLMKISFLHIPSSLWGSESVRDRQKVRMREITWVEGCLQRRRRGVMLRRKIERSEKERNR